MAVYGASTLLAMQPCDPSSVFFGFMGVTSAIVFANMGAAYGTAKSGVGISSMGVMRPDMVMRSIIPVVMAGVMTEDMARYGASTVMAMQPCDPSSAFFGFMGVTSAIVFANMGAAYGTAKSGVGISSMGVMRPDMVMRSIIPVVMAGVLGIYGLISFFVIFPLVLLVPWMKQAPLLRGVRNDDGTALLRNCKTCHSGMSSQEELKRPDGFNRINAFLHDQMCRKVGLLRKPMTRKVRWLLRKLSPAACKPKKKRRRSVNWARRRADDRKAPTAQLQCVLRRTPLESLRRSAVDFALTSPSSAVPLPERKTEVTAKPKSYAEAVSGRKNEKTAGATGSKLSLALRLWEGAWPKDAVISQHKLQKQLENEETITATVALVHHKDVQTLKDLASAHGYTSCKLALVCADLEVAPKGHTTTWLQLHVKDMAPQLRKVAVTPLAAELPAMPSVVVRQTQPITIVEAKVIRVTMRKSRLEEPSRWPKLRTTPVPHILQTLCPNGHGLIRAYGWRKIIDDKGTIEGVTGFLRVTKEVVDNARDAKSGKAGVFEYEYKLPGLRLQDETDEDYYLRALKTAGDKGLAFRRGGGAYLGARGAEVQDTDKWKKATQWRLHGVPPGWTGDQVVTWLDSDGWTEPTIAMPPLKKLGWVIRATPPSEGWCHGIEIENGKVVALSRYIVQRPQQQKSEAMVKAGNGFQRDPVTAKPPAPAPKDGKTEEMEVDGEDKMDEKGGMNENDPLEKTETRTEAKNDIIAAASTPARSQVRTEAKNDIDAKRASLSAPWGLQELGPGGDGDCGYRAIGVAYGLSNGETVEKVITEAKKLGATLRARATARLRQKKKFKDSFAVDDMWTTGTEDGPIPTSYEEWLIATARPRRWIDGPGFAAAATVLARQILIFKFVEGRWCRVAHYEPRSSDAKAKLQASRLPVLPVFLRNQHYTSVVPATEKAWPSEWSEPLDGSLTQQADCRGAGKSTASAAPSGNFDEADRILGLARTFSSSSSSASARTLRTCATWTHSAIAKNAALNVPAEVDKILANARNPGGSEFRWTCGECRLNLTADSRLQLSSRRTKHLQNRHGGGQRDPNSRLNGSNFVFKVSEAIPEEQREWNCPLCKGGLPHMSRFDKLIAVQAHIKAEHPKQTPWKLYRLRRKRDPVLRKVREENGAKIRKTFDEDALAGRTCTANLPNWMEWTGSLKGRRKRCGAFISCARCFKGQASLTGVKCSGKAKFVKPQAQKFWKLLRERGYMNPGLIATAWKTTTAVLDKYYGYADPASVAFTGPHLGSHNAYGSEGPRRRLSKGSVSLLTWCLNVSAATVAWQVLEDAAVENVDAIALQEVKLDAEELKAFGNRADSLGYACFATRAKSRTKDDKEQGGAVFLVSKLYKSRIATKIVNNGGQATLVWVNGTLFGSCYAAHDSERLDFLQDLNTYVYAMDSQTVFHLMGDWNDEPDESPLAAALESAGGRVQATGAPTRWEGRRCIGYVITNAEKELANLREECAAYSDHKLLCWERPIRGEPRERWRLKKTTSYAPPSGCDVHRWQQNVASAWPEVQQDVKPATNREQLGENTFDNSAVNSRLPSKSHSPTAAKMAKFPEAPRIPEASAKADPLDECFETRVWRNNLGRLKELARLEADEDQTAAKSNARQALADKLARAKKVDLARPRPYEKSCQRKISKWVKKIQSSESAAYRWLDVRRGPPIHNIFDEEGEAATQDIGEVLRVLVTHWRKVWHRSGPDLGNLHQLLEKVLGPKRKQQKWAHVSATELAREAKKQAGAAASVDGWSGDEVVSFSIEIWEAVAAMFRDCERLGLAPEDLANARQAHIPKEGKDVRETDGALHAAAMRPITVLSALWRVWGRARLRNSDTAEWLESWLQPEICGGRRNVDALSSVIQLLEAACDNKFIATFDYSLAFDFTSPKLAAEIFEWLGMPIGTANLILSVWESQRRVLQYAGEANTNPEEVKTSLPQGDPWSLIAMAVVLLLPLLDLRRGPETTDIMLYVDDRAWASTNASDCMNFGRKWKDWSSRLGLKENEAKEKYYHQNYALALEEFAKVGAPPKTISGAPALLGEKKLDQAALVARKARSLPLPASRRLRIAAAEAVPKAAYGWLCEAPTEQMFAKVEDAIARAGPNPAMGDRDLKKLFRGHSASPYFMAGQQVLMAAWRRAKRSKSLPGIWRDVGWVHTLCAFLQKIGCLEVAAWRWTTRLGGIIDLDPSSEDFDQTSGAVGHNTREAWRQTLFERWLARTDARTDSRQCQASAYNEQRCTLTRKLVANDTHRFAVVTGASVSPQKFEEVRGADWEHMVWKCEASGKPPELAAPADLLQRRLGWASTARTRAYNFAVLDWMAEVLTSWSQSSSTFPLYGLIAAVIINGKMDAATYSAYSGYARLGAGLTVGMSSLAAGLAIGIVGDAGVRTNAQQPRLFVGMILILIFLEALGLYGLIVGLVVASTAEGKGKGLLEQGAISHSYPFSVSDIFVQTEALVFYLVNVCQCAPLYVNPQRIMLRGVESCLYQTPEVWTLADKVGHAGDLCWFLADVGWTLLIPYITIPASLSALTLIGLALCMRGRRKPADMLPEVVNVVWLCGNVIWGLEEFLWDSQDPEMPYAWTPVLGENPAIYALIEGHFVKSFFYLGPALWAGWFVYFMWRRRRRRDVDDEGSGPAAASLQMSSHVVTRAMMDLFWCYGLMWPALLSNLATVALLLISAGVETGVGWHGIDRSDFAWVCWTLSNFTWIISELSEYSDEIRLILRLSQEASPAWTFWCYLRLIKL
ncbi:unnamed protein product [Polarella glacialis]|uniref:V-type proton ATPase proteolipid subunit n=1 Tax=Polarella glacialis TaxID=89957 RepID=A0A813IMU0_POLGL|nr:unnamed protein product [Polarella glacialis]